MRSKQKRYTAEFKNQIVKEVKETGNASLVARKHDLVTRWLREANKANTPISYLQYSNNKAMMLLVKKITCLKNFSYKKDIELAIPCALLKNEPTLKYTIEIAKKWIDAGYNPAFVL